MFDRIRQQSRDPQDSSTVDSPTWSESPLETAGETPTPALRLGLTANRRRIPFISSLTPMQRFILALLLFANVSLLGCFALLVFDRISF